jgi:aldehyde dehydrogenase (NAD+)
MAPLNKGTFERHQLFIDGKWVDPSTTAKHTAIEASTGEVLGTAGLGSPADIDAAVRAARLAVDKGPWGHSTPAERASALRRFADVLHERADETVPLVSRENGMPITTSRAYNGNAPEALVRLAADLAESTPIEEVCSVAAGHAVIRREPVGVVGAISPWNYPQTTALAKLAPALAAGNAVVLKHSRDTAFDSYVFAEAAIEAGMPNGVLNIVLGTSEAGPSLVTHPLVDKISFTGSTDVGRGIAAECGRLIRRVTLELGGKSAAVVCEDVDLDLLYSKLGESSFVNNGQACTAQTRILAPRSRYEEVVDTVAQFARDMVVGDALDPATTCGPMASERQRDTVMGYIETAKVDGARLVAGGSRPSGLDRGWFVEPTVFADVDNNARIAREEVFGPVMVVIPYEDDDDAVRIAHDSNYGLGGSVWSADQTRAVGIARRVRTGSIGVNNYSPDFDIPFGGMKDSGLGREFGVLGLQHYFEVKAMYLGETDLSAL